MRVAITGGTGFLGGHLAEAHRSRGDVVSILTRSEEKAVAWRPRVDRVVVGDIADSAAVSALVEGAEIVLHLVSNFRSTTGSRESFYHTNVRGTEVALEASRRAGVRRFVHCSTIGVHGHVRETPADESSPFRPGDLYQETKALAERAAQRESERSGMDVVIVRPCSMYGPGDLRMLKMFRMLAKRTFFTLGRCRENFHAVYIDDLVDGFRRVVEVPELHGEIFILGGPGYVPLRDYLSAAAKAVGAPRPWIRLPYAPALIASVLCEAVCRPLGVESPLHPRRVRFFRNNRAFSIEKARRRLGYDPRVGLEEGMARTVAWYRAEGLL